MRERDMTIQSVQKELDDARLRLESLGAGGKLATRDKIARLERRLQTLRAEQNPSAAPAAARLP